MKVEKRISFGFRGDWGKVYKRYTTSDTLPRMHLEEKKPQNNHAYEIMYENNAYVDIGQDVQFKRVNDTTNNTEQTSGVMTDSVYTTVQTTDAYFDDIQQVYVCVAANDDIVKVFGRLWMVTNIRTVVKHNPKEQQFFYLELKGVA